MARENSDRIMAAARTPYQISTGATRRMSSRSMLERTTPISKARTPASNKNKRWCAMAKCKSAVIANLLIDELTKEINAALIDPNTRAPSRWVTHLDDDHHPHKKTRVTGRRRGPVWALC